MTIQKQVIVRLQTGLHARPAARFVQEASRFTSDIFVKKADKSIDAKSIMGIMSLSLGSGVQITISAEGADAEQAVNRLAELVEQEA